MCWCLLLVVGLVILVVWNGLLPSLSSTWLLLLLLLLCYSGVTKYNYLFYNFLGWLDFEFVNFCLQCLETWWKLTPARGRLVISRNVCKVGSVLVDWNIFYLIKLIIYKRIGLSNLQGPLLITNIIYHGLATVNNWNKVNTQNIYFSFQPVLHDWWRPWYVLYCLWDGAYKRTLAVNR